MSLFVHILWATATVTQTPLDKQVEASLARIEGCTAIEPPIFAIDTQLLTARVLTRKYPKLARQWMDRAADSTNGLSDSASVGAFRVRAVEQWSALDFDEAIHVARGITDRERRGEAFDNLAQHHPNKRREMVETGLSTGAFPIAGAQQVLESLMKKDPGRAQGLFATLMGAFPSRDASENDVDALFAAIESAKTMPMPLVVQAIEKILHAVTAEGFRPNAGGKAAKFQVGQREVDVPGFREEALLRVAAYLHALDPDLYEQNRNYFERWSEALSTVGNPSDIKKVSHTDWNGNSLFGSWGGVGSSPDLPIGEAIDKARAYPAVVDRVSALLDISEREDIPPQRQSSIAAEALELAPKLPDLTSRLLVLSSLAKDFSGRGDSAMAISAARLLADAFVERCHCADAGCDSLNGREECADMVGMFAQYLDENHIKPETLDLDNASLNARLAVIGLAKLLGEKLD